MQLRHLRVRNIRSYESGTLDFGPGTTLITGDVGAGKTSLLYAIEMALFGTTEVDAGYLVRHGGTHAEVEVAFEDDAHRYEIVRRFRRVQRKGRSSFEPEGIRFAVDGATTEYSATELRQRVIELLGFPDNPSPTAHSDLWRWAVYIPQERMRDILAAKPVERLETVRKALGVERYRTAADNAQDLASDLRRTAAALRSESDLLRHFDDDFAAVTGEADRLRIERATLEEAIARGADGVRAIDTEVEALDRAVRRSEADRRELSSLEPEDAADAARLAEAPRRRAEQAAAIAARQEEADAALQESAELPARQEELVRADAARLARRAELDGLAAELRELHQARADLASAERRLEPARRALTAATAEAEAARSAERALATTGPEHEPPAPTPQPLDAIDRRLAELRAEEATALTERTRAEASLHEFEELLAAGVCPRCHQAVRSAEFEPHRREAAELAERSATGYRDRVAERRRVEAERAARERYERARERWLQVERERAAARTALEAADARTAAARGALAEVAAAMADATARRDRAAPIEPREAELRSGLDAAEEGRTRLAAAVERARLAAERARAAAAAVERLVADGDRTDRETDALRRRVEERGRRIDELRTLVAGADDRAVRLRAAEQRRRSAQEALEETRRASVRVDTRLDEAARRLAEAERGRAERARRVREAVEIEARGAWTGGPFREAVLRMERQVLAHAQAAFGRDFARYFATLIEDPAMVADADATFTPSVVIEGEWTPAEALSGGERTGLALAFRLALAQVVRALGSLRLDTILLDEPTDGFSPEQIVRMGELLNELALPQVILVSHEDELAGIADRVVRVAKVDGASTLWAGDEPPVPEAGAAPRPEAPTARRRAPRGGRSDLR